MFFVEALEKNKPPVELICTPEVRQFWRCIFLWQIQEMLNGLLDKIPADATPLFHSVQGWQYQHAEYQRLLSEHNITKSMSRKGNCIDNGAMENFFGRLKVEMFYGKKFQSVNVFIDELKHYIDYYNERISTKLKGMSPVQFRTHSHSF